MGDRPLRTLQGMSATTRTATGRTEDRVDVCMSSESGRVASLPVISVVIPTYERAHVVSEAIASVLRQTYSDFELLVVDDGSSDETAAVVSSFQDERLRLVSIKHGGRSRARNEGVTRARGEVVVFLDSDDRAEPDWLRELVLALDGPAAVACCGARVTTEPLEETIDRERVVMPRQLGSDFANRVGLFLAGTFAVRRRVLVAIGGYDSRLAFAENSELAIRLVRHCEERALPFVAVHEPLVRIKRRRAVGGEADFRARLEAAELMLQQYSEWHRRARSSFCANYQAVAAVNAYRLGLFGRGIRHFAAAVVVNPGRLVHWGRLSLALVPPLARRFWTRQIDAWPV